MRWSALLAISLAAIVPSRAIASTFVDEAVLDLERRLTNVNRPGLKIPANEPRNIDRHELLPRGPGDEERRVHLFRDLQVRRSGSAAHIVGAGLPVDLVSGVLPGTLLAMRVGAEANGFGLYVIGGGGTFTAYRHIIPRGDAEPVSVQTQSAPFGFVGLGTELRLFRALALAGEVNWGTVIASRTNERVMSPVADEAVRSTALAVRVDY